MDQVLDYMSLMREKSPEVVALVTTLLAALLILILGLWVARLIRRRIRKSKFGGTHLDQTLRPVLASIIFYVILALTVYAALVKLGVPPTSLIAIFGAAGLAIGLALKDTLSNIASGIMMLVLRPLAVGEVIDTGSVLGSVEEIGLFSTAIKNTEGVFVFVPNQQVWSSRIQNFGRHTERKAIIEIGVGYDTDLERVKTLLLDVLSSAPGVMFEPAPPEVFVMGFGDSAINLSCRCWLPPDNWLQRTSDLRIAIKTALDKANVEIPFPQRVVHMKT